MPRFHTRRAQPKEQNTAKAAAATDPPESLAWMVAGRSPWAAGLQAALCPGVLAAARWNSNRSCSRMTGDCAVPCWVQARLRHLRRRGDCSAGKACGCGEAEAEALLGRTSPMGWTAQASST
jgi:hypothetical protein